MKGISAIWVRAQFTGFSAGKGVRLSQFWTRRAKTFRATSPSRCASRGSRPSAAPERNSSSSVRTARLAALRKSVLRAGLVDELPELVGIKPLYGVSVHHCLYCDGFEYAGKPVAAYGRGDKGAELAVMIKYWIADVVACSDGTQVSAKAMRKLAGHNIPLRTESIRRIEGTNGELTKIVFQRGPDLPRAGLFFSTGCHQASDLSKRLGCKRGAKGDVVTDPDTEETSVPGVYVAGDMSRDVLLVAVAIAEGAQAAVAINKAFLRRDGFCEGAEKIGAPGRNRTSRPRRTRL